MNENSFFNTSIYISFYAFMTTTTVTRAGDVALDIFRQWFHRCVIYFAWGTLPSPTTLHRSSQSCHIIAAVRPVYLHRPHYHLLTLSPPATCTHSKYQEFLPPPPPPLPPLSSRLHTAAAQAHANELNQQQASITRSGLQLSRSRPWITERRL